MRYFWSILLSACLTGISFAQTDNLSALSIKEIMKGEEFVGYLPGTPWWSEDGKSIYFSWNPDFDTLRSTYKIDVDSRQISRLTFEELKKLPSKGGDYNDDFTQKVYEKNGDIFLYDIKKDQIFQVTNTVERESNPRFSGDGQQIIYQSAGNLFLWDMQNGSIVQLTNFISGNEKKAPQTDAMQQWLEQDQLAYFKILSKQKDEQDAREYRNKQEEPSKPLEIFLGKKQLVSIEFDPTSNYIVYMLMDRVADSNTIVPDFVTQSGYTTDLQARSKVGSDQNKYETWVYNLAADSTYLIKTDKIPGIYDKPEYRQEYEKSDSIWIEAYHDPREVIVMPPKFSDDGQAVVVVRSQDNKDRWIMKLDLADGSLTLLDRQRDEAWVGGPGISGWNFSSGNIGWIDNETIWYQSEETGYSHLYVQNVYSNQKRALTSGAFEIKEAELSRDRKTFFITSNLESPHEHHFNHLPLLVEN